MTGEFLHKWPVTRNLFPFDDVIMITGHRISTNSLRCRVMYTQFCSDHFIQIWMKAKRNLHRILIAVKHLANKVQAVIYINDTFTNQIIHPGVSWWYQGHQLYIFVMTHCLGSKVKWHLLFDSSDGFTSEWSGFTHGYACVCSVAVLWRWLMPTQDAEWLMRKECLWFNNGKNTIHQM